LNNSLFGASGKFLVQKIAALCGIAAIAAASMVTSTFVASPAAAAGAGYSCPADGSWPNMGNLPKFTDNNVTLWSSGNALLNNAEAEGLIVVGKDLKIQRNPKGLYNLGWVGVQVTPQSCRLGVATSQSVASW
jgi:hypothetical protein